MARATESWAAMEFKGIDLGGKRLNRGRRSCWPSNCPAIRRRAFRWPAAAYRFFAQDTLEWTDVMEPHWQSSTERMRACEVVLCLDDTTELNFNGQEIAGLGPLSYEAQRGMYIHATYAVTPQREPLGVLNGCGRVSTRTPEASVAASRKARAGSRDTNGWPSRRWICPAHGWCMSQTVSRTLSS